MANRTVNIGALWYVRADGVHAWGFHGTTVDVHLDDLDRFDAINEPVPVAAAESADDDAVPPTKPAGNASKEDWQEYARALGATDADIDGKTRAELREQFGA